MDSDNQADRAWLLSVQRKSYRWKARKSAPLHGSGSSSLRKPLASRVHNERCTPGSERGREKPVVREDHKALASYSTYDLPLHTHGSSVSVLADSLRAGAVSGVKRALARLQTKRGRPAAECRRWLPPKVQRREEEKAEDQAGCCAFAAIAG